MAVATVRPMVDEPVVPPLEVWSCSRCKNPIAHGVLTVGSIVQIRCHHSIKLPDGTRKTCGWLNRMWPSR